MLGNVQRCRECILPWIHTRRADEVNERLQRAFPLMVVDESPRAIAHLWVVECANDRVREIAGTDAHGTARTPLTLG